jgi:hypothetical protein
MCVRFCNAPTRERVDLWQTQMDLRTPSDRTTTASAAAKPVAAGAMSATGRSFLAAIITSFSGSSQSTETEADEPSPSDGRESNFSLLLSKPGETGENGFRFRLSRSASSDQIKSTRDSSRAEAVATMSSTRSAQTTRTPSARTKAAYWLFRARQRSPVVARIYALLSIT